MEPHTSTYALFGDPIQLCTLYITVYKMDKAEIYNIHIYHRLD